MLNEHQIIGHLGKNPETRTLQNGDSVCNLSVATTERWTKGGERQERTEWHRVTIWGKLAEIADKYLEKGSKVYLKGKIQTRKWTDQDGKDRYSTETVLSGFNATLVMLDGPSNSGGRRDDRGDNRGDDRDDYRGGGRNGMSGRGPSSGGPDFGGGADLDDEIPF